MRVNTNDPGVAVSPDGKWKRLVLAVDLRVAREQGIELNYVAVSTTRPSGRFHLKDIQLHQTDPGTGRPARPAERVIPAPPVREPVAPPTPAPTAPPGREAPPKPAAPARGDQVLMPDAVELMNRRWAQENIRKLDITVAPDGWITLDYDLSGPWSGTVLGLPSPLPAGGQVRMEVEGPARPTGLEVKLNDVEVFHVRAGTTTLSVNPQRHPDGLHSVTIGLVKGKVPSQGTIRLRLSLAPSRRSEVPMAPPVSTGVATHQVDSKRVSTPIAEVIEREFGTPKLWERVRGLAASRVARAAGVLLLVPLLMGAAPSPHEVAPVMSALSSVFGNVTGKHAPRVRKSWPVSAILGGTALLSVLIDQASQLFILNTGWVPYSFHHVAVVNLTSFGWKAPLMEALRIAMAFALSTIAARRISHQGFLLGRPFRDTSALMALGLLLSSAATLSNWFSIFNRGGGANFVFIPVGVSADLGLTLSDLFGYVGDGVFFFAFIKMLWISQAGRSIRRVIHRWFSGEKALFLGLLLGLTVLGVLGDLTLPKLGISGTPEFLAKIAEQGTGWLAVLGGVVASPWVIVPAVALAGLAALVWTARHVRSPTWQKALIIPALLVSLASSFVPSGVRAQPVVRVHAAEVVETQLTPRGQQVKERPTPLSTTLPSLPNEPLPPISFTPPQAPTAPLAAPPSTKGLIERLKDWWYQRQLRELKELTMRLDPGVQTANSINDIRPFLQRHQELLRRMGYSREQLASRMRLGDVQTELFVKHGLIVLGEPLASDLQFIRQLFENLPAQDKEAHRVRYLIFGAFPTEADIPFGAHILEGFPHVGAFAYTYRLGAAWDRDLRNPDKWVNVELESHRNILAEQAWSWLVIKPGRMLTIGAHEIRHDLQLREPAFVAALQALHARSTDAKDFIDYRTRENVFEEDAQLYGYWINGTEEMLRMVQAKDSALLRQKVLLMGWHKFIQVSPTQDGRVAAVSLYKNGQKVREVRVLLSGTQELTFKLLWDAVFPVEKHSEAPQREAPPPRRSEVPMAPPVSTWVATHQVDSKRVNTPIAEVIQREFGGPTLLERVRGALPSTTMFFQIVGSVLYLSVASSVGSLLLGGTPDVTTAVLGFQVPYLSQWIAQLWGQGAMGQAALVGFLFLPLVGLVVSRRQFIGLGIAGGTAAGLGWLDYRLFGHRVSRAPPSQREVVDYLRTHADFDTTRVLVNEFGRGVQVLVLGESHGAVEHKQQAVALINAMRDKGLTDFVIEVDEQHQGFLDAFVRMRGATLDQKSLDRIDEKLLDSFLFVDLPVHLPKAAREAHKRMLKAARAAGLQMTAFDPRTRHDGLPGSGDPDGYVVNRRGERVLVEKGMAKHVTDILAKRPHAKVLVYAGNRHAAAGVVDYGKARVPSAGRFLKRALGDKVSLVVQETYGSRGRSQDLIASAATDSELAGRTFAVKITPDAPFYHHGLYKERREDVRPSHTYSGIDLYLGHSRVSTERRSGLPLAQTVIKGLLGAFLIPALGITGTPEFLAQMTGQGTPWLAASLARGVPRLRSGRRPERSRMDGAGWVGDHVGDDTHGRPVGNAAVDGGTD
ncbi:MAG: hypothetical protein HYY58_04435 [Candidatus Omnitrophica bacterium]|nr:hypothetical protein [Candidatus Omnitrophota bacterium]